MEPVIKIEDMRFCYREGRYVLDGVDLSVAKGESVGIIGCNGAGKSTFLKILVGLLPDYEGSIRIAGCLLEKRNYNEIRRSLGYVFQDSDSQLFMNTVQEDVAFGPMNYGFSEEEAREAAVKALRRTHIADLAGRHVYRLSGGEKKLVAIAGILALQQEEEGIILMDEPSMGLSPIFVNEIFDIIKEVSAGGTTVLLVEQNAKKALSISNRAYVLETGKIVLEGKANDLLNNDSIKKAYLGE